MNLRISAILAGPPGERKPSTGSAPAASFPSLGPSSGSRPEPSFIPCGDSSPGPSIEPETRGSGSGSPKSKTMGLNSVSSAVGIAKSDAGRCPAVRARAPVPTRPVPMRPDSASVAVSLSLSAYVPAAIARASSIKSRNDRNACNARAGRNFRSMHSPIAPHSDSPVSSATRSATSIVVLPIPRTGVLITRSNETESSGL